MPDSLWHLSYQHTISCTRAGQRLCCHVARDWP